MKSKAKRLEKACHRLQSLLYDFQDELEDKRDRAISERQKLRFEAARQAASNAGFELDESQFQLQSIQKL